MMNPACLVVACLMKLASQEAGDILPQIWPRQTCDYTLSNLWIHH